MPAEKQESDARSVVSDPNAGRTNGGDNAGGALGQQANQAIEGLRSVIEERFAGFARSDGGRQSMGTKYRSRPRDGAGPGRRASRLSGPCHGRSSRTR